MLDQVRDCLQILRGVEEAVAEDGGLAVDWRITAAGRNSPLTFECQAFPRNHAVNIDSHAERVLVPTPAPYREHGSIEGRIQSVGRDGHRRKLPFLCHRVTGDSVKCFVSGKALADVEDHRITDVFQNRRVLVIGTLHYKSVGKLSHIDAKHLRFLRPRSELPQIDDIVDPDFTGGVRSEDYLEEMRNGRLS